MLERELVESIAARPSDEDLIARGDIAPDYRYYLEPTSDSDPNSKYGPHHRRPDGVADARVLMAEAALGEAGAPRCRSKITATARIPCSMATRRCKRQRRACRSSRRAS